MSNYQTSEHNARLILRSIAERYGLGPEDLQDLRPSSDPPKIMSPDDAFTLIAPRLSVKDREVFVVICLDTRNGVKAVEELYVGTINSSHIRVAEVFKKAITINSPSIIIAHNHPSGDPTPSPEDVSMTKAIFEAGKLLDIELLDHLVIGSNSGSFISLKTRNLGFGG